MSSPQMTRMFGRCPDGAGWACACVTASGDLDPRPAAVAAASVVPPSSMLRRLRARPSGSAAGLLSPVSRGCLSWVLIVLSPFPGWRGENRTLLGVLTASRDTLRAYAAEAVPT